MNTNVNEIKYQTSNLCDAMLRNINDNFLSVSFDFDHNDDILVKVILEKRTGIEEDYIEDIIAEFSALQKSDCVKKALIEVGYHHTSLPNLVYYKKSD